MLLAFALRPTDNCIDVGAHQGTILRQMIRCAPDGRHLAFEPIPELAAELKAAFPLVDVRPLALAASSGPAEFRFVRSYPAYSGLQERAYPGPAEIDLLTVQTARLDDELPPDYVPRLIKIDVEGAEEGVLRGAEKTILRHRPIIVFEHGSDSAARYGTTSSGLYDLVTGRLQMRIFDLDGEGPYSLEAFTQTWRWNFVARE